MRILGIGLIIISLQLMSLFTIGHWIGTIEIQRTLIIWVPILIVGVLMTVASYYYKDWSKWE